MQNIFVWTFGDVMSLLFFVLVAGVWGVFQMIKWWGQLHCKHNGGVNETQACDAICRKCGKNLGFIGTWRGQQKVDNQRSKH